MQAAETISHEHRDAFLKDLSHALGRCGKLGDGAVFRAIREAQGRFYVPPERVGVVGASKYSRRVRR